MRLAVECYADSTVLRFLKNECGLSKLVDFHAFSQGEVVNAVVRDRADVGMVDEDPGRSHHSRRDGARLIAQGTDVDLHELDGRHLLIVKPDLEQCFIRGTKRLDVKTCFRDAREMHTQLSRGFQSRKHQDFSQELGELRRLSREKRIDCFITELESSLRELLKGRRTPG